MEESAEARANVYRRISLESLIKEIYNYSNMNSRCKFSVPIPLFRLLRCKILNKNIDPCQMKLFRKYSSTIRYRYK